tara:strand:- start:38 stop:202 length:165 start_codon:yes stop_codon:yes gene_type:complete
LNKQTTSAKPLTQINASDEIDGEIVSTQKNKTCQKEEHSIASEEIKWLLESFLY